MGLGLGGRFNWTWHDVWSGVQAEFTTLAALRFRFGRAERELCASKMRMPDFFRIKLPLKDEYSRYIRLKKNGCMRIEKFWKNIEIA